MIEIISLPHTQTMKRKPTEQLQKDDNQKRQHLDNDENNQNASSNEQQQQQEILDENVSNLLRHQHQLTKQFNHLKRQKYLLDYQFFGGESTNTTTTNTSNASTLLQQRNQLIDAIPEFWLRVFMNHSVISECVGCGEVDVPLLNALKGFDVKMFELGELDEEEEDAAEKTTTASTTSAPKTGFEIVFTFADNDWIQDKQLWKRFLYSAEDVDALINVQQSGVTWKKNWRQTVTKEQPDTDLESFFERFDKKMPHDEEIFLLLKEEIFMDPMQYYLKPIELDEDEEAEESG